MMKPKFEINEVARVMVASDVIRIHEVFMADDDIGDLDQAIKYVAVSTGGCVWRNLDERMIMKESNQDFGKDIPKAGEMDVSKEIRREVVPIKVDKAKPVPEKSNYKKRAYKKKKSYKRKSSPRKPRATRTKKPAKKDNPFEGMPDI